MRISDWSSGRVLFRSPTLANGEVERAYSPRNCAPRLVAKSYASSQLRRISTGSCDTERTFVMNRERCQATCRSVARYSASATATARASPNRCTTTTLGVTRLCSDRQSQHAEVPAAPTRQQNTNNRQLRASLARAYLRE